MPPTTRDDAKEQIRARLDLVEVVGQHVRLTRRGREFIGLCPFHQEKTPSFTVNQQMQSWYCFGCQRGGDIFKFVQELERTDFRGALEALAERSGVELRSEDGRARERSQLRRRIVEMNRLAAQYYEYVLHSTAAGRPGVDLLTKREVGEATARGFQLGYAPAGGGFADYIRKRGRSVPDAIAAGLLRSDGRDFFRARLIIPIRSESGQPVAFVGRTVDAGEPRKYLNSPETPAYVKGRVLFALDLARHAIAERGHAVLMEGQFDVIVAHQFGVQNAVASSGTALTEEQVRLLKRFTQEVVLVFDADAAGKAAAFRAIEQAEREGLRTRVVTLVGAKDPDEYLRGAGDEAESRWLQLVESARPGWDYWIHDSIQGLNPGRQRDLQLALDRIQAVLTRIPDPAVRESYRQSAGRLLGYDPTFIGVKVQDRPPKSVNPGRNAPDDRFTPPTKGKKITVGRYLLQVLAVRPDAAVSVRERLAPDELEEEERATYARMVELLKAGGLEALNSGLGGFDEDGQDLIRRAWASPPPRVDDEVIDDVVLRIRRDALQNRLRGIMSGLAAAEQRGDSGQVAVLESEHRELARAVEALNPRTGKGKKGA